MKVTKPYSNGNQSVVASLRVDERNRPRLQVSFHLPKDAKPLVGNAIKIRVLAGKREITCTPQDQGGLPEIYTSIGKIAAASFILKTKALDKVTEVQVATSEYSCKLLLVSVVPTPFPPKLN